MVKINSKTSKPTPVDNDILLILDSEVLVGGNPTVKKFTYKNLVDSLSLITAPVLSVNGMIGDVIVTPDDLDDSTTTNKFVTSGDKSNWDGKENSLGNPSVDDYILSSKTDGTRIWIELPEGAIYTSGDNVEITDDEDPDYDRIIHVNESNEICANTYELMKFLIPYMRYTYVVDENNIPVVDENGDFIVDIDYDEVRYWLFAILNVLNGGTVGQVLIKNSSDDLDFSWYDIPIQPNYQADWDESDPESESYILNKPTIPTTLSDLSGDLDDISDGETYVKSENNFTDDLSLKLNNIEDGAEVNVQSDWTEDDIYSDSYIANKPINTNSFSVPIEFPEDFVTPPDPSELYQNVSKKVRIRKFRHTSNDEVVFDWATPHDMDTTKPMQFRVKGIKTEVNGEEGEESWTVRFGMKGYASRDLELSEQPSFGTPQTVTKDIGSGEIPQHSVYITNWSADLTVPNISNDSINQFWFYRDISVTNNYLHSIAVIEIEIKYTKR